MENVVYEHFNYFKEFDKGRSFPFENWPENNKPKGGLWGCRVGCSYGWPIITKKMEEHAKKLIEEYGLGGGEVTKVPIEKVSKFQFILKPWAKNYIISTFEDYEKLPKMNFEGEEVIDYEQCFKDGIDAIELCAIGDEYDDLSTQVDFDKLDEVFGVYWDCDSIVVLNPDAYEIV